MNRKSREVIATEAAPRAVGPYSQAIAAGDLIFSAGQIALDPATMKLVGETAADQTRQIMQNLQAVLAASGASPEDVLKTTIYLVDMADFVEVNTVYAEVFGEILPARSTVAVAALPLGARVEIDFVARRPG